MQYTKPLTTALGSLLIILGFFPSNLRFGSIQAADLAAPLIFGGAFMAFWGSGSAVSNLIERLIPVLADRKPQQERTCPRLISRNLVIIGTVMVACSLLGLLLLGYFIDNSTFYQSKDIEKAASRILYGILVLAVFLMFAGRWISVFSNFRNRSR